jgi:hypothetical protein
VSPPAGRHALLWVALAAVVCATRPVVAWVQESSWVAVSTSGTGMHTDTHALWRVAVTAHGFGGFDAVRLVPVTPGAAVLGGSDVADLLPRGRVTFTVSVPLDVRTMRSSPSRTATPTTSTSWSGRSSYLHSTLISTAKF